MFTSNRTSLRTHIAQTPTLLVVTLSVVALVIGWGFSRSSTNYALLGSAFLLLIILVILRQYEALAVVIIGVRIIEDFYHLVPLPLYFPFVALALAMGIIALLFLAQSDARPWVSLPFWGVWLLFLALPVPAMLLAVDRGDSITYYLNVFASAAVFAILGTLLARDVGRVRRLLSMISALGAAIAAHGIVASLTGVFLLSTPTLANYLVTKSYLRITGTQFKRLGSFLFNPDTCGIFLAVIALLALGCWSAALHGALV
jgi:hypothetical protein